MTNKEIKDFTHNLISIKNENELLKLKNQDLKTRLDIEYTKNEKLRQEALKNDIYILRYTDSTGEIKIATITNNPEKWLIENNKMRDEAEKLSDFDIEITKYIKY